MSCGWSPRWEGKLVWDTIIDLIYYTKEKLNFFLLCASRSNTKNNESNSLGARFHFNVRKNLTIISIIKLSRLSYKKNYITGRFKTEALTFSLIRKWPPMCHPTKSLILGYGHFFSASLSRIFYKHLYSGNKPRVGGEYGIMW